MKENITVEVTQEDGSVKETKIYIQTPSNQISTSADRYRAKIWTECIQDGVLTKLELSKILKARNIWSDEKDKEHQALIKKISDTEKKLYLEGKTRKISEGQELALQIRRLRLNLRDLIAEKVAIEDNTAESLADNARFDFIVAGCTYYENGEKVYKDIEDYNKKASDEVAFMAAAKMAELSYGLAGDFEKSLPENKWLLQFNLVNDDLHLINKEQETIDLKGRTVNNDGQYVNSDGKITDKEGNLLNDDGTYVLKVEYKTDTPKRTRVKK